MSNDEITQTTSVGHNVTAKEGATVEIGDLIITSLSSKDLVTFSKKLFQFISYREWSTAEAYLASLKSVGSLDDECKTLIALLEYKLSICQDRGTSVNQDLFLDLLRSRRSDPIIKDIVESIFLHHLMFSSKASSSQRYLGSIYKGSYSEELFYERLATSDELIQRLKADLSDVYEYELCSFVRCAIRNENFQLASELAEVLAKSYPSNNSKILLSIAHAYRINKEIDGRHYWLINSELMQDLKRRIDDCVANAKASDDYRVINAAAVLLSATGFQSADLIDICLTNVEAAAKVVPHIREILEVDAEKTKSYKTANQILNKDDLTIDEDDYCFLSSEFLKGNVSSREVNRWLEKGGKVSVSSPQAKALIPVILNSLACTSENVQQKLKLAEELDSFIEGNLGKIEEFNVLAIHHLCGRLNRVGLSIYVVRLLEPFMPTTPWSSPVVDAYAEALLASDQIARLDGLLKRMRESDESFNLLVVKINRALLSNNFTSAIEHIERALIIYPNSCFCWAKLLDVLHMKNSSSLEVSAAILRIPSNILNKYSVDGLRLIFLVARNDLSFAESIVLEWFIDDPVGMAVHVTNLHFSSLIHHGHLSSDRVYLSDRCSHAVVYESGKRQYTKLLVNNCNSSEYLLESDSNLGGLLQAADIGEKIELGMARYTVLERLTPIIGAFRISLNIRQDINTGTDCFHQFSTEGGDVTELLEQIDSVSNGEQLLDPEIDGKSIPLLMRLAKTHKNDLVRGALTYLFDKESNRHLHLFSEGDPVGQSEAVVLDVLSLVYLSITGFCHGLIKIKLRVYITAETREIVSRWLGETGRADFLSITKIDTGFMRTTADDVAKDSTFMNLNLLLGYCEIITPTSMDMPEALAKVRDVLDVSHYSSLKASISCAIPFLCLDHMFCYFYRALDVKLANVYQFMVNANFVTPPSEGRHIMHHIQYGLAAPITHRDVIELCSEEEGQYWASEILDLYPTDYKSAEVALDVLSRCCVKAICSAYFSAEEQLQPSHWRYAERVVNTCCRSAMVRLEGGTSERKLAVLIAQVLGSVRSMNTVFRYALELFNKFIKGHFLDASQIALELKTLQKF